MPKSVEQYSDSLNRLFPEEVKALGNLSRDGNVTGARTITF